MDNLTESLGGRQDVDEILELIGRLTASLRLAYASCTNIQGYVATEVDATPLAPTTPRVAVFALKPDA